MADPDILPVDLPDDVPPYDIDFLGEPRYDKQREEIRHWNLRKIEARAVRRALPMWPLYLLVFVSCLTPAFDGGAGVTRHLVSMGFGYSLAQIVCVLRSALLEHRAERKMQQGIQRLLDLNLPGTP